VASSSEHLLEAHPSSRPYLSGSRLCPRLFSRSSNMSGVGGFVSWEPRDFMVHELPKYLPSGEGEHCMTHILKVGKTTEEAIASIAEGSGVTVHDIGYAGRKDKKALTTQWISLLCAPEQVKSNDEDVCILGTYPHRQKMKLGHNYGNLFTILISDIDTDIDLNAEINSIRRGIPNYFGTQRFGRPWYENRPEEGYSPPIDHDGKVLQDPDNPARDNVDRALLFLEKSINQTNRRRPSGKQKRDVKLALSALQSALFNLWVGERIRDELVDQVIEGDVCRKREGGTFYSTDPKVDTERLQRGEIDVLGPMFGPKLFPAQGYALQREESLYENWGLDGDRRNALGKFWRGDRRPALLTPQNLTVKEAYTADKRNLYVSFILPAGSFATTLLGALIDPTQETFHRGS